MFLVIHIASKQVDSIIIFSPSKGVESFAQSTPLQGDMNLETHLSLGVTESIVSLEPKWPLFCLDKSEKRSFRVFQTSSAKKKHGNLHHQSAGENDSGTLRFLLDEWECECGRMTIMYKYYGTASWCTHMIYSSLYIMIYQYHVYLLSLWYSRNNCLWHCHFSIIFSCICINMRCLDFCSATQSSGGFISPNHPETRQTFVLPSPACSNWRKFAFWLRVCRRTRVIERSFTHLAFWDPEIKVWTWFFLLNM